MFKFFLYILGVFMVSVGIFLTVLDLNVLTIGYSFSEFGKFIIRRREFYYILLGIILIAVSLERWIKNELLLRHSLKLERKERL